MKTDNFNAEKLRKEYGRKGEESAASFLCGKGFTIVGRNVRCGHLETDIIAKNDRFIVFCEVKTRSEYPEAYHKFGRPAFQVDFAKREKLFSAAGEYLKKHESEIDGLMPRLDIIEVYLSPDTDKYKVLKIFHMEDAIHR